MTGNAGSGKSTLALKMAELLNIPVYSLDLVVWGEHWQKVPQIQRTRAELALAAQSDWIIEGVSPLIGESADCIVFLDYPRWLCFVRCALRNVRYLFSSRPGLPDHCPEILIIPRLVQIIWRFPHKVKPLIEQQGGTKIVYRLTSSREVAEFIAALHRGKQLPSIAEHFSV